MKMLRMLVLALGLLAAAGCGGGGGGGDAGGGGSAVSGHVPYLLSAPTLTFAVSGWDNTKYDITVTVEADGPTGVQFGDVFIIDDAGTNFAFIDLVNVPGTKRWRGTTNMYVPMPSGNYIVEEIMLHDGDPLTADPLRSGWYMMDNIFSTSVYFVDEREETAADPFAFYNWGLSSIPITRVTVTS